MDQVKEHLSTAMKHGFWIGSAIVFIGTVAVWYLSTADLSKKRDAQVSKITSNNSAVDNARLELPTQPNEDSHAAMEVMIKGRTDDVLAAWEFVFENQRKILTWPEKLGESFLREFKYAKDESGRVDVNTLKLPFEKYEEFGVEEANDVPPSMLRDYERYIGDQLPSYAEIAKAEWTANFDSRGAMGAMGMGPPGMSGFPGLRRGQVGIGGAPADPVVIWSTGSQDAVLNDLFPWRGAKDYPSELDVYYSQENLWILKQLLQIIAEVNGDAQQNFEAKIREIKALSIGKSVKFNNGSISKVGSRASMGGMGMGMGMGMGPDYDDMDMMGMGGMDDMMDYGSAEEEVGPDPGENRYVNTAFEPISAADLRSALTSNQPSQVAIAVAKRVPVMLQLQINQRAIPALLAACGSAPLMVDVHQVRLMQQGGSFAGAAGGDPYAMMGGDMMEDDMMGMGGMGMGGMGGMGGMPGGGTVAAQEEFPLDLDVELYGLIYFYNPPHREALGLEEVVSETSIDESAETIDPLPTPTAPPVTPDAGTVTPDPNATTPVTPEEPTPEPTPVDPTPAPVDPTPAPVDPTPAPVDPGPAGATPEPSPAAGVTPAAVATPAAGG